MTTVLKITNRSIALVAVAAVVVVLALAALAQGGAGNTSGPAPAIEKLGLPFAGKTVVTKPSRRR